MDELRIGTAVGVAAGFVVSIVAHHLAHARVAIALGDRTPKLHGRVSLSIKNHTDTLGTVILPIVWTIAALFGTFYPYVGWGKAQHLSPHLMRNPKRDVIIVALAGPAATLVIGGAAVAVASGLQFGFARQVVGGFAFVAVFLTVWEILPLPGRDGGRILARFLSPSAQLKMQDLAQYEVLFVVGVFLILSAPITWLANRICFLFGDAACSVLPGF